MSESAAEDWIRHDGGPCPVRLAVRVTVKWANGSVCTGPASLWAGYGRPGLIDLWQSGGRSKIIAYRIEDQPE